MSVTSPASDDLNAERDYEYADDEFLTKPEISFSPSTESEAVPQRGHKAESRFTSGAEALTSAWSDDDLFDKGQLCPHAHFFNGEPGEYEEFFCRYHISVDVVLSRVKSNEIKDEVKDRPEHIIVPLMAICEAGLRFPLHPFLMEVLARFSLAPHQLAINSYRIIMLVITLIEGQNLNFTVADLFHTYTMFRHGYTGRWYLTTRLRKEPLIMGLSHTDKWADFYLDFHGNFKFGGGHRRHSVPRVKDTRGPMHSLSLVSFSFTPIIVDVLFVWCSLPFAKLGPISKGLNINSGADHCETLLAQACRDAPTLLDYVPSYKGVLKEGEEEGG